MTSSATGSFAVNFTPHPTEDQIGRLGLSKTFEGDLVGTSTGQMMSHATAIEGSGVYVALEIVTGVLSGRSGSFALYHWGTMHRGVPDLHVTIVPDSGTDGFVGISGELTIERRDGAHFYDLKYDLPGY